MRFVSTIGVLAAALLTACNGNLGGASPAPNGSFARETSRARDTEQRVALVRRQSHGQSGLGIQANLDR